MLPQILPELDRELQWCSQAVVYVDEIDSFLPAHQIVSQLQENIVPYLFRGMLMCTQPTMCLSATQWYAHVFNHKTLVLNM